MFFFFLLGLNLELNIEQNEYIGAFTEEAGVRIDISNQGEMPFPREKGLSAAPGFATSVGMRKASIISYSILNKMIKLAFEPSGPTGRRL